MFFSVVLLDVASCRYHVARIIVQYPQNANIDVLLWPTRFIAGYDRSKGGNATESLDDFTATMNCGAKDLG